MRAIAWDMLFLGLDLTDTIVARVTGRGPAGLAVVRLSGSKTRAIAARMAPQTRDRPSHQLHRTAVCDAEGVDIDEGMAVSMHAPKTYTGEDVVEFFLHGADVIADAVVQAAVALGARLAQPGEFTRRAFAAGRITLAQAEAVGALGGATSGLEQQHALGELKAGLSQEVLGMLEQLEPVLAGFFAVLDFPEHPTEMGAASKHSKVLVGVLNALERRIKTARNRADAPDEVVLAGASNVGKSTLFNALVGHQRALVDEEAGTTRDKISAPMVVGGLPLMLSDTAGLRATPSAVEQKGIALGQQAAQGAELVLWLIDAAHPVWPSELRNKQLWVVGARADRFDAHARLRLEKEAVGRGLHIRLWVSGFTSEGVSALTEALVAFRSRQSGDGPDAPEAWMAQPRHLGLLETARQALVRALAHLEHDGPLDLAATELRLAIDALGQIVGRNVDAAVLDQIFLQFCIGK